MNRKVIIILLLAITLRLININQSLWLDEATSALIVRDFNLLEILKVFSPNDFHPPLYYLLLKLWSTVFGTSEIALRLLSILFGIGTVVITCKIAQSYNKKRLPIIVGLLMATAPLHIYYSQEARMYSMATFLVATSAFFFMLFLKKEPNPIYAFIAGTWFGLALMTEYMVVFMAPVFLLWCVLRKNFWQNLKHFVWFLLPVFVSVVALLPVFIQQFSGAMSVKASGSLWWDILGVFSIKNILLVPIKLVIGRISFDNDITYAIFSGTSIAVFACVLCQVWRSKERKYWNISLWLILPVLLAITTSLFIPVLYYFRLLYVLPALYLLVGIGLLKLREKYFLPFFIIILGINLLSSGMYLLNEKFHREDWKGLVGHITHTNGNNQVVFVANSQMEAFDYYGGGIERVSPQQINGQSDKLWLMRYVQNVFDPNDEARQKIEDLGFEKVNELNFNGVVVWEYIYR